MSDENRVYYIAAGKCLEDIEKCDQRAKEVGKARAAFLEKMNGDDLVVSEERLVAIVYKDAEKRPKGWVPFKRFPDAYRPTQRSWTQKRTLAEMGELRQSTSRDVGHSYIGGGFMHWPRFEKLGDAYVISQHEKADPPEGGIPIARSEYWRRKEEAAIASPEKTNTSLGVPNAIPS